MTRSNSFLSAVLFTTIGVGLAGTVASGVSAKPCWDGYKAAPQSGQQSNRGNQPEQLKAGSDLPDGQRDNSGSSQNSLSFDRQAPEDAGRNQGVWIAIAAIASVTTVTAVSKWLLSRAAQMAIPDALSYYPELEHPELALTSVPQEALPSLVSKP